MAYRQRRIKNKVHRIKPKKSILRSRWFWIIFIFLIVISSALYFFLFYPGFQIKNVLISGNQRVSAADIRNLAAGNISNKIFSMAGWQLESGSIFLENPGELSRELLSNFPAIESIRIEKKFPQTLAININERIVSYVFCPFLDKSQIVPSGCFLMDGSGTIFEPITQAP